MSDPICDIFPDEPQCQVEPEAPEIPDDIPDEGLIQDGDGM